MKIQLRILVSVLVPQRSQRISNNPKSNMPLLSEGGLDPVEEVHGSRDKDIVWTRYTPTVGD